MRLIDADKLLMMLADWWYSSFREEETEESKAIHRVMDEVEKYVKNLPSAQPEQRWIPTSVKPYPNLPEEDVSGYFFVTLHTYGNIGFDMDEYEVKKMRWDRVNGWAVPVHSPAWIEEALTQDVLAWRPCPEPYREGGVK